MKLKMMILLGMLCFVFYGNAQFSGMGGMSNNSSSHTADDQSQNSKTKQLQGDVFRGLSIHADIGAPIISLLGGYARSYEVQLDVNLFRRIFPIFEMGYATAQKESLLGIVYDTKAPFFRFGLNYGLLKPFKDDGSVRSVQCYPFVGVRYALSPVTYNISNIIVEDDYWGTSSLENLNNKLSYAGWIEAVGGVRVDLFKGLTIGWSVRFKTLLHTSAPDKSYLWYVPGYGKSSSMGMMFNYTIGYTFYSGKDTK